MRSTRPLFAALLLSLGGSLAPGQDPAAVHITAPAKLWLLAEVKVGWLAEKTTRVSGRVEVERYAIVGEEEGCWRVEAWCPELSTVARHDPSLQGRLLGLTVRKADGIVISAVLGRPGEAGAPVRISSVVPGPPMDSPPQGVPDPVTIAGGEYAAIRRTQHGVTTWTGTEGATSGLLLKLRQAGKEDLVLVAPPTPGVADVGGTTFDTVELVYSSGLKQSYTRHEVIVAIFGGLLRMESKTVHAEVTRVETDAAPQLIWD